MRSLPASTIGLATLITVLLSWMPVVTSAQRAGTARVGFLATGSLSTPKSAYVFQVFRESLRSLGYVEGQNLVIEYRGAAGRPDQLERLASELTGLKIDAMVVTGPAGIRAATRATTTMPIVAIDLESDPVASGFVASLARPGGNVTGVFLDQAAVSGKWLQLLGEVLPKLSRVAVFFDPANPSPQLDAVKVAARSKGVEIQLLEVSGSDKLETAFHAATQARAQAGVVLSAPLFSNESPRVADLALRGRLASIAPFKEFSVAGGLMAYGPDEDDNYRRLAALVDRVLRGTRPGDVPVERSARFTFVINTRTANVLGLTIPQALLLRADQVIQ